MLLRGKEVLKSLILWIKRSSNGSGWLFFSQINTTRFQPLIGGLLNKWKELGYLEARLARK